MLIILKIRVVMCDTVNVLHKPVVTSITSSCYTNVPIVQVRHTIKFEFASGFVTDGFVLEPHQSRVFRGWPAPIECCKRYHAEILVMPSPLKTHLRTVSAGATEAVCARPIVHCSVMHIPYGGRKGWWNAMNPNSDVGINIFCLSSILI